MAAVDRFFRSDLGESEARQEGCLQNLDSGYECSIVMVGGCLFMCLGSGEGGRERCRCLREICGSKDI